MILHICPAADWTAAGSHLRPASLAEAGFVHCSDPGTVHLPANGLYRGRTDLLLLEIDESALDVPLRWEQADPPHPEGLWFPHVYGPLPRTAIRAAHPFPPESDGSFRLPVAVARR